MKTWFLFLFICGLGCQTAETTPKGILPPKKFAQALVELSVIEAAQQQKALPPRYHNQPGIWTSDALSRLNTDTAEFNRSYRYYYTHPEKMKAVLSEMQKTFNQP